MRLIGLDDYVVLKGDKIYQDRKMCDCIIFVSGNQVIVGIIELKSNTAHASEIGEKLKNSSEFVLEIFKKYAERKLKFEFFHIVLKKGWQTSEFVMIKSIKIKIEGRKYDIITKRCGISFSEIISTYN